MKKEKNTPKVKICIISSKALLAVGMIAKLPAEKQKEILKVLRSVIDNG